jgi:ATP-binding cassette subfamily B protein
VSVRAAGHEILTDVDLSIAPGSHVAIVGPSGAGKSSLVGLLLGWHRPGAGRVTIDGAALDARHLERLRRETVWIDPAVQLWNASLMGNLTYGARSDRSPTLGQVVDAADLYEIMGRLPHGLQTLLGENGGLLSSGEAQRVRFGRGMMRQAARLVILDEPFRGLDRAKRSQMLARARAMWGRSTLLCITHDVGETSTFDRVLVLDGGRVVEDGAPRALAEDPASRYHALLAAEEDVRAAVWSGPFWRRLRLEGGRLREAGDGRRP